MNSNVGPLVDSQCWLGEVGIPEANAEGCSETSAYWVLHMVMTITCLLITPQPPIPKTLRICAQWPSNSSGPHRVSNWALGLWGLHGS